MPIVATPAAEPGLSTNFRSCRHNNAKHCQIMLSCGNSVGIHAHRCGHQRNIIDHGRNHSISCGRWLIDCSQFCSNACENFSRMCMFPTRQRPTKYQKEKHTRCIDALQKLMLRYTFCALIHPNRDWSRTSTKQRPSPTTCPWRAVSVWWIWKSVQKSNVPRPTNNMFCRLRHTLHH